MNIKLGAESKLMAFQTAELCDQYSDILHIAEPYLLDFGGILAFHGEIATVKCFEDNSLIRTALETKGNGKVLVVDGGGSLRCALIGDQLATLAQRNNWNGAVVNGCIRDSAVITTIEFGLKALATHPLKSVKKGLGERDVPVKFAGITFRTGHYLYADQDGIVVSPRYLTV